jgi:hypothetical protein
MYAGKHPYANGRKMVAVHVMLMEIKLKRPLKKGEVVHHVNGNLQDNRLCNLMLLSRSEHSSMHAKTSVKTKKRDWHGRFYKAV